MTDLFNLKLVKKLIEELQKFSEDQEIEITIGKDYYSIKTP